MSREYPLRVPLGKGIWTIRLFDELNFSVSDVTKPSFAGSVWLNLSVSAWAVDLPSTYR
ncbi:hypothetical protein D3C72_2178880 [compost metagenome]